MPTHPWVVAAMLVVLLVLLAGFVSLGVWQVQRMGWKHALIARVESRIHAEPVAAPLRTEWPEVTRDSYEYRRVRLEGEYLAGLDTQVQAVTELGAGFWVMTPFRRHDGSTVLVNRGFVPIDSSASPPPRGLHEVTGLLRIDEPDGGFLRRNDPIDGRWYSRDVNAIAHARGLARVAPFFVDAARDDAQAAAWPRGGMTVVRFRDSHLVYALTWFALAGLVTYALWRLLTAERRLPQRGNSRRNEPVAQAGRIDSRE